MRFYFDLKFDAEEPSSDEQGTDLEDVEAAQIEAARTLCDFSRELIGRGRNPKALAVIIRDEGGPILEARLSFQLKRLN